MRLFLEGTDEEEEKRSKVDGFRKLRNRYEVKRKLILRSLTIGWLMVLAFGSWLGVAYYWNIYENRRSKGLGFDLNLDKAISCVARGVSINQEDIRTGLQNFEDDSFDWVIFSRMVEELAEPGEVLREALRVGKRVAVSFVNHGYWKNRLNFVLRGRRVHNEIYPHQWESSHLSNHFSIREFEEFCRNLSIKSSLFCSGWSKGFPSR